MAKKPELFLYKAKPIQDLPAESAEVFKNWIVNDGLKPSVALRKFMEKYECPDLHPTIVVRLLEITYPDLDVGREGFRFRIVDSAYPNSVPDQFSDDDFDKGVEELLALPPGW